MTVPPCRAGSPGASAASVCGLTERGCDPESPRTVADTLLGMTAPGLEEDWAPKTSRAHGAYTLDVLSC